MLTKVGAHIKTRRCAGSLASVQMLATPHENLPGIDEAGVAARWFVTGTDIQDRKQEEEGIRGARQIVSGQSFDLAAPHEEARNLPGPG